MSKPVRVLVIFLLVDVLVLGAYFLAKGMKSRSGDDLTKGYDWVAMDAYAQPATELEQFIKTDFDKKGLLPIQYRNYGRNAAILKKFRGSKYAGTNASVLEMTFPGLEDWAVVDILIQEEDSRDTRRTVLYIQQENEWKVADSGRPFD